MVDKANEAITAVERAQSSAFKSGNERAEQSVVEHSLVRRNHIAQAACDNAT
jgi:hypothetical protein